MRVFHELTVAIAHDFNNALCGALGFIELALKDSSASPRLLDYLGIARNCLVDAGASVSRVLKRVQHECERHGDSEKLVRSFSDLSESVRTGQSGAAPPADTKAASPQAAGSQADDIYHPGGLRILVVDDEAPVLRFLRESLCRMGHRPTVALDAEEALALFRVESFDLVITDLGMPRMAGDELAGRLRELAPEMPILMLTGWADHWSPPESQPALVNQVLAKPITWDQLQSALAAFQVC